jgi:hypothetical protein
MNYTRCWQLFTQKRILSTLNRNAKVLNTLIQIVFMKFFTANERKTVILTFSV